MLQLQLILATQINNVALRIGIIDTGADHTHKRFKNHSIKGITLFKNLEGEIKIERDCFTDEKGHGTGIVSIILQHIPDAEIEIVKLASANIVTEDLMFAGIKYLVEQNDVKLINISMGIKTMTPSKELRAICDEAFGKGIVIVAAVHYLHDKLCYPAHFNTVFGVGQGIVASKFKFRKLENKLADILAKGGFQRVAVPDHKFRFSVGTSLATAHFTGVIGKAFVDGEWSDIANLKEWLNVNSDNSIISLSKHDQSVNEKVFSPNQAQSAAEIYSTLRPSVKIAKIAIYPFEEKEMQSLLEFPERLTHELTLAIGYPRSLKLDKTVKTLEKLAVPYVLGQLKEESYDLFDTLVIGYFLDKLLDQNSHHGYQLITECVKRNKNFIVWDSVVFDLINSVIENSPDRYNGEIYLTTYSNHQKEMLYETTSYSFLKAPSICVVGTNKRQGKFTTQLIMKNLLEKEGYKVGHLATEPQGILLGADLIFPIGYKTTVEPDIRDWSKSLRFLTQIIEENVKPEIVITGSQGSIIPLHPVNDSNAAEMLSFVKAFYPDGIICAISPNDSIEQINKTTTVIKAFVNCTVLFYVLTPLEYNLHFNDQVRLSYRMLSTDEYQNKLDFFNANLDAPTFNIRDESNYESILNIVQQTFSKK